MIALRSAEIRSPADGRRPPIPDLDSARSLALSLPEAVSADHFDIESFRVRGKIFATVPDDGHLRVMLDEATVDGVVSAHPAACAPLLWGAKVRGVVVELARADDELLSELLLEAWARKAPRALVDHFDPDGAESGGN